MDIFEFLKLKGYEVVHKNTEIVSEYLEYPNYPNFQTLIILFKNKTFFSILIDTSVFDPEDFNLNHWLIKLYTKNGEVNPPYLHTTTNDHFSDIKHKIRDFKLNKIIKKYNN